MRAYYYPIKDLYAGQVYHYRLSTFLDDTLRNEVDEYWYFRAFDRDSGLFLVSTNYDHNFEINQIVREKITPSGAIARDYMIYEPDTVAGKSIVSHAKILAPAVYPFQVTDSAGVFLFRLEYNPPSDTATRIYLIRNRRYQGETTPWSGQGAPALTIKFSLQEAIGAAKEGAAETDVKGYEIYAKNIGLVEMSKVIGGRVKRSMQLKEVFPMTELEKRAGKALDK